uniref:CiUrabin n=1 Tax=Ciona intestinalis TaxID=7719 RepID=F8WQ81_CIOIN|nr:uncharacterized protein LOC100185684 precursor [Ciona intestinalis]BAK55783.1 CiUrabin [Ciona intestinalis]|eukprot:NP_001233215.1 uncharacterized protein LOC100185684 precursor [Ciona intestinalis]
MNLVFVGFYFLLALKQGIGLKTVKDIPEQFIAEFEGGHKQKRSVVTGTVLTASEIKVAVDKHNEYRRIVVPSASNMLEMVWDPELGKMAQDYSRTCTYAHSSGRRTSNFTWVGENLYLRSNEWSATKVLEDAITGWDNEKKVYTYSSKACSRVCGHYTQTAWAESYAVGCGVTTCSNVTVGSKVWSTAQIVVCNYGPGGNIKGKHPYISGSPCSACPKGYGCKNGLCSLSADSNMLKGLTSFMLTATVFAMLYTTV